MNDEFLYRLRKPPRQEFAAALFQAIQPPVTRRGFGLSPIFHRFALGFTGLCLALALVLAASPSAQAMAHQLLIKIGWFHFEETGNISFTWSSDGSSLENISEEKARAVVPFAFNLPTWMPDGFPIEARFRHRNNQDDRLYPWVNATWESPRGHISLGIRQIDEDLKAWYEEHPEKVGNSVVEEVTVKDQPAALLRGVWVLQGEPVASESIGLTWNSEINAGSLWWEGDGLFYRLLWDAPPDVEAPLTVEEIIRIAESIP